MKKLLLILLATTTLYACSKDKADDRRSGPLNANPEAKAIGNFKATLTSEKSTGPIVAYGWELNIYSPTQIDYLHPISFSPNDNYEGNGFIPITVTVSKVGVYNFGLLVHDKDGNTNYDTVSVDIK